VEEEEEEEWGKKADTKQRAEIRDDGMAGQLCFTSSMLCKMTVEREHGRQRKKSVGTSSYDTYNSKASILMLTIATIPKARVYPQSTYYHAYVQPSLSIVPPQSPFNFTRTS
jgi:hypothetical protein